MRKLLKVGPLASKAAIPARVAAVKMAGPHVRQITARARDAEVPSSSSSTSHGHSTPCPGHRPGRVDGWCSRSVLVVVIEEVVGPGFDAEAAHGIELRVVEVVVDLVAGGG